MAKAKKKPLPAPKSPGGADKQTLYRIEYCDIARRLIDGGATHSEVANILGVSDVTMWRWRMKHPNFNAAIRLKENVANERVEYSYFNQAVGFYVDEEEIKVINGEVVRIPVRRYIPPSEAAARYWLKVKGQGWRDDEMPVPPDETAQIIDGIPEESDRQRARRIAFMLIQGGKKEAG